MSVDEAAGGAACPGGACAVDAGACSIPWAVVPTVPPAISNATAIAALPASPSIAVLQKYALPDIAFFMCTELSFGARPIFTGDAAHWVFPFA